MDFQIGVSVNGKRRTGGLKQNAHRDGRHTVAGIALSVATAVFGGCAVGPDFHQPAAPDVTQYTHQPVAGTTRATPGHGGEAQTFAQVQKIPQQWWSLFHSSELNALIERAFKDSPTVAAAQAALRESEENLKAGAGALYPSLNVGASAAREKVNGASFGGGAGGLGGVFNLYTASVNVAYDFDVFGGTRRTLEGLQAQVDFQRYELQATYLTLASNVVTAAITEAALRAQIAATREIISAEAEQVKLVKQQVALGAAAYADVLSAQSQLALTRATLPPLQQRVSQARHALATLTGQFPAQLKVANFDIDALTLPQKLPLTLPSELVRQRPDIRASESALHAASAQVGVATAALYPSISISGSYGQAANKVNDLFGPGGAIWNLGANLMAPIFQGGTLRAKKRAAVAAYEQTAANYQQTVLTAFQQVADVLRALEHDAQALSAQSQAVKASGESLALSREQYKAGASSYLAILLAERQYQQARIGYVEALGNRYQDTAALFQALGGGWWSGAGTPAAATPAAATAASDTPSHQ
jgi:NodT family efflux transporter outer membrane factor (OMF) lipoprotein